MAPLTLLEPLAPSEGAPPPEAIAEALREALFATGRCARHVLLRRVAQRLSIEPTAARKILSRLEAAGDATGGPGGQVASAPLRLVATPAGDRLVLGTLPDRELAERAGWSGLTAGIPRRLRAGDDAIAAGLDALEGLALDAATWAGLDRAPAADAGWLRSLDARLHEPLVSPDRADWSQVARYDPGRRRWRGDTGPLLRARQPGGWAAYAWSIQYDGGARRLRLTRSEAHRTRLALEARADNARTWTARRGPDGVILELDTAIPWPEYRYLMATGHRLPDRGRATRYAIPEVAWPTLRDLLKARLQIQIEGPDAEA